ncbi:MAG: glycoside hydrolase family 15 protein [Hyphomicrobiales bacterium]
MTAGLHLALIGNCCVSALLDPAAQLVWGCFPRFDGDPVFHALLGAPTDDRDAGVFAVDLDGLTETRQEYEPNTAVVRTRLISPAGAVEVTDFAPRFKWRDRSFRPQMLVRRVKPLWGSPRIRIRLKPRSNYGADRFVTARGSNHVRFVSDSLSLRLTTDAPIDYIASSTWFILTAPVAFLFGIDEAPSEGVSETAADFEARTLSYWREWVQRLAVPFEWQDAVIRAAITLKLCSYEPTGAIVAALTTSLPEAPDSGRNWDYRYCWLRDAFFVVRALNSLSAIRTMELHYRWLMNIVAAAEHDAIQPVYGVALEPTLTERIAPALPGLNGMGPVRVGNRAYEQPQHDTYGHIILAAAPAFFDQRLLMGIGEADFVRLEGVGEHAYRLYDCPDAGIWEYRTRQRVHTSSAVLCWAGCDRLARIARRVGRPDRAGLWEDRAEEVRRTTLARSWSEERQAFVESFEGRHLDASVLLMSEVGMIAADDPRFVSTVDKLERSLARGALMMRYEEPDDFGPPHTAFNVCAFWRIAALARMGRKDEAREHFQELLSYRNPLGLMSEDTAIATGTAWGNFPQTYSMAGIINAAMGLSVKWEEMV